MFVKGARLAFVLRLGCREGAGSSAPGAHDGMTRVVGSSADGEERVSF